MRSAIPGWAGPALALGAGLLVLLWPPRGVAGPAVPFLAVLAAGTVFWARGRPPEFVVALGMAVAWTVTHVAPPSAIFAGFASSTWFLILGVLGLAAALGRSGLLYRITLVAMQRFPPTFAGQVFALALSGIVATVFIPSIVGRLGVIGPVVVGLAEAFRYPARSSGSAALGLATLVGFCLSASLFLTGTASCLVAWRLLPEPARADVTWLSWLLWALPLEVLTFSGALIWIIWRFRPADGSAVPPEVLRRVLRVQIQALGPVSDKERIAGAVAAALVLAWLTQGWHGVEPASVAVAGLCVLVAAGALDRAAIQGQLDWPLLLLLGVIFSLGDLAARVGVDAWLTDLARQALHGFHHPVLALTALVVATMAVRLVLPWPTAVAIACAGHGAGRPDPGTPSVDRGAGHPQGRQHLPVPAPEPRLPHALLQHRGTRLQPRSGEALRVGVCGHGPARLPGHRAVLVGARPDPHRPRRGRIASDRREHMGARTVFRSAAGVPAPAVVIAHGFAGSQQLMQPFAVTLAHSGYVAVTFDFPGHGRNPTPLPGGLADPSARTRALLDAVGDVAAFARRQPSSTGQLALLGHSMGSDAVVRYAQAHPEVEATVAVSLFSRGVTAESPRNLLVIDGAWEPAMLLDHGYLIAQAAAAGPAREGVTYGRFAHGTARRLALADGVERIGVLYSRESMAEARDWVDHAFGRLGAGVLDARGPWLGLLYLGVIALAWPLAGLLPRVAPRPRGAAYRWRELLPVAIAPALLTPLILWPLPRGFLPILLGDYLALHFGLYGLLTGAGMWIVARARGHGGAGARALPPDGAAWWPLGIAALRSGSGYTTRPRGGTTNAVVFAGPSPLLSPQPPLAGLLSGRPMATRPLAPGALLGRRRGGLALAAARRQGLRPPGPRTTNALEEHRFLQLLSSPVAGATRTAAQHSRATRGESA